MSHKWNFEDGFVQVKSISKWKNIYHRKSVFFFNFNSLKFLFFKSNDKFHDLLYFFIFVSVNICICSKLQQLHKHQHNRRSHKLYWAPAFSISWSDLQEPVYILSFFFEFWFNFRNILTDPKTLRNIVFQYYCNNNVIIYSAISNFNTSSLPAYVTTNVYFLFYVFIEILSIFTVSHQFPIKIQSLQQQQ